MQVGEAEKVKFSLFKNRFVFACGQNGLTLEKVGGGICLYATDHTHQEIYCAMPLGMEREFKDAAYFIYAPNEHQMLLRVHKAVMLVDFEGTGVPPMCRSSGSTAPNFGDRSVPAPGRRSIPSCITKPRNGASPPPARTERCLTE